MNTLDDAYSYWIEHHPEMSKLRSDRVLTERNGPHDSDQFEPDPKKFLTRWFQYQKSLSAIDLAIEHTKKKLRDQLDEAKAASSSDGA